MKLWLDLETYSEVPIKYGTYRYAENAEIMLFAYALDDGEAQVVDFTAGETLPDDVVSALYYDTDSELWAHNAMFDRVVINYQMGETYTPKWRDTLIQAYCHSLPGSLEKLGQILGLPQDLQKMQDGKRLVQLFCKPLPANRKLRRATRETHPEEWARFKEYARQDIVTMREIHKRMPTYNYPKPEELAHWHLDQKVNDRGFHVDLDLVNGAIATAKTEQASLKEQVQELTAGTVRSTTQRDELLSYMLAEYGVAFADLTKATANKALDDPDIPEGVKELLRIRLQASATSTSKYAALKNAVNNDGRCRGTIQFRGGKRTGRAAGRTFQPQNLPSRGLLEPVEIDFGIDAIKGGFAREVYPNTMHLLTSSVRGVLQAPPGKKLVVADLSNIEGRMNAWLSGEAWKLQAFRDADNGTGHDLYNLTYAKSFQADVNTVTKPQRQIGKVQELMLGYGGGVGAFVTGALTYEFDLEELARRIWDTLPGEKIKEALDLYDWFVKQKRSTFGLSKEAFIAADVLKRLWREANPNIAAMWGKCDNAAKNAIANPGQVFWAGEKICMRRDKNWLRIKLPSGRFLCYPSPRISDKGEVSYMGENPFNRKWCRIKSYGGKWLENCIAKDTPVMTNRGWVSIQNIRNNDLIWDGEKFVAHGGLLYRGKRLVYTYFNVRMTPEHKILTTAGWRHACESEGYNRVESRLPNSYEIFRIRWKKIPMGSCLPLRENDSYRRHRIAKTKETWNRFVMWMYAGGDYSEKADKTRFSKTPHVRDLAVYDRPLSSAITSCLEKLRCAWHNGMCRMAAIFYRVHERYAPLVSERLYIREVRQFDGVFARQLCMENKAAPSEQQTRQRGTRHTERENDHSRGFGFLRDKTNNSSLPVKTRMGSIESVYDIADCGPHNRFVVKGSDGLPLIVHNCTQGASADVIYASQQPAEDEGYKIVIHVHDELVTETPDEKYFTADKLASIMSRELSWSKGLPLAAAGEEMYRYRK